MKAEIVASATDAGRAIGYLRAVEQPQTYPDEFLYAAAQSSAELRALDARVYGAILECLQGTRKHIVEARIRSQGHAYAGGLALRRLDAWFEAGPQRKKAAATRDLITLTPRGQGAVAMEEFLAKYRLLLQQAGSDNVGIDAQVDILRRGVEDHPKLGSVWAAWHHAGGRDPARLIECLEDVIAGGLHGAGGPRHGATAWAAIDGDHGAHTYAHPRDSPSAAEHASPTGLAERAHTARTRDAQKRCYRCGRQGHTQPHCPDAAPGHATGQTTNSKDNQEPLMKMMAELLAELKAARGSGTARKPKKD